VLRNGVRYSGTGIFVPSSSVILLSYELKGYIYIYKLLYSLLKREGEEMCGSENGTVIDDAYKQRAL
jgi:hypothetical protein